MYVLADRLGPSCLMPPSFLSVPPCRDVLNVLGMYPGDPGPPGGDCAGVVLRGHVRHGDTVIAGPGDAVFGLAAGSLGSHVIASSKTVVPMPPSVTFEEAATMPTVFITVDTALHRIAALAPGHRVLVHAAAGGVGLAAMQLIQAVGAAALATAGSPAKRALLRSLGAQHVVSSRDTAFASELALQVIRWRLSRGKIMCHCAGHVPSPQQPWWIAPC